jgi:hypothetical protein
MRQKNDRAKEISQRRDQPVGLTDFRLSARSRMSKNLRTLRSGKSARPRQSAARRLPMTLPRGIVVATSANARRYYFVCGKDAT